MCLPPQSLPHLAFAVFADGSPKFCVSTKEERDAQLRDILQVCGPLKAKFVLRTPGASRGFNLNFQSQSCCCIWHIVGHITEIPDQLYPGFVWVHSDLRHRCLFSVCSAGQLHELLYSRISEVLTIFYMLHVCMTCMTAKHVPSVAVDAASLLSTHTLSTTQFF